MEHKPDNQKETQQRWFITQLPDGEYKLTFDGLDAKKFFNTREEALEYIISLYQRFEEIDEMAHHICNHLVEYGLQGQPASLAVAMTEALRLHDDHVALINETSKEFYLDNVDPSEFDPDDLSLPDDDIPFA